MSTCSGSDRIRLGPVVTLDPINCFVCVYASSRLLLTQLLYIRHGILQYAASTVNIVFKFVYRWR
jgi:hypothetical protein